MSDTNGKETYQQKQSREAFEGYIRRGLTYDYLYEEYIIKNRSLQSLADEFEIKMNAIRKILNYHNIIKNPKVVRENQANAVRKTATNPDKKKPTLEQSRKMQLAGAKSRRASYDKKLAEQGITYDYLYDLYIIQNKSLKELMEILDKPKSNVRKLLERFEMPKKTREMVVEAQINNLKTYYADEEKVKAAVTKGQALISERYGNKWYRVTASSQETELLEIIQEAFPELLVKSGDYSVIKNPETNAALQLDIYIPELNFAIEFNGEYWHDRKAYENDLLNNTCTTREMVKVKMCAEKDITLAHVWNSDYKADRDSIITGLINDMKSLIRV